MQKVFMYVGLHIWRSSRVSFTSYYITTTTNTTCPFGDNKIEKMFSDTLVLITHTYSIEINAYTHGEGAGGAQLSTI